MIDSSRWPILTSIIVTTKLPLQCKVTFWQSLIIVDKHGTS